MKRLLVPYFGRQWWMPIAAVAFLALLVIGVVAGPVPYPMLEDSMPRPRFEFLLWEDMKGMNASFQVYHDKETGQEIVCVMDKLAAPSCYLTGRSWK